MASTHSWLTKKTTLSLKTQIRQCFLLETGSCQLKIDSDGFKLVLTCWDCFWWDFTGFDQFNGCYQFKLIEICWSAHCLVPVLACLNGNGSDWFLSVSVSWIEEIWKFKTYLNWLVSGFTSWNWFWSVYISSDQQKLAQKLILWFHLTRFCYFLVCPYRRVWWTFFVLLFNNCTIHRFGN